MITISRLNGRLGNRMTELAGAGIIAKYLNLYLDPQSSMTLGNWTHEMNWGCYFHEFFSINSEYTQGEKILQPSVHLTCDFVHNNLDVTKWPRVHYHISDGATMDEDFTIKYGKEYNNFFKISKPVEKQDGVFVHFRGGDQVQPKTATLEYYREAFNRLGISGGYITTDGLTYDHPMVKQLCNDYNLNRLPIDATPIHTLLFARGFRYMILDRGTYSWWLGVLAQPEKAYCYIPPREFHWGAETYKAFPNWEGIKVID